jgi:hypothetical protein
MVKNIVAHNGYHGCERCQQKGVWLGKMTFPECNAAPRTDSDFESYDDHVNGASPLRHMNVRFVSDFVIDYMHLVLLGVTKRLMSTWIGGKGAVRSNVRVGPGVRDEISVDLTRIVFRTPSDFARMPRCLDKFKYYKATEFRQITLYTGIVVFRHLGEDIYKNFLLYNVALSILVDPQLCHEYHQYAKELLELFVEQAVQIYGPGFIVYNVHNLVHLADDVARFGNLDNISAFPFENFLQRLKKMCRRSSSELTQVVKRYYEGLFSECSTYDASHPVHLKLSKPHARGPVPPEVPHCEQYSKLETGNTVLRVGEKDGSVMIKGKIGLLRNILRIGRDIALVYSIYRDATNFYEYPLDSSRIGVFAVARLSNRLLLSKLCDVNRKYFLVPLGGNNESVAVPIRHLKLR